MADNYIRNGIVLADKAQRIKTSFISINVNGHDDWLLLLLLFLYLCNNFSTFSSYLSGHNLEALGINVEDEKNEIWRGPLSSRVDDNFF